MLPPNRGDKIVLGEHEFSTLVSLTDSEHSIGLMGQPWPPPIMTFAFNNRSIRKFWMKNTPSPLDIVFIRNAEIVSIERGEPESTRSVGPDVAVDYVVELPAGTCHAKGISVGQPAKIRLSTQTIAQRIKQGDRA